MEMPDLSNLAGVIAMLNALKEAGFGSVVRPLLERYEAIMKVGTERLLGEARDSRTLTEAEVAREIKDLDVDAELERERKRLLEGVRSEALRDALKFQLDTGLAEHMSRQKVLSQTSTLLLEDGGATARPNDVEKDWYASFFNESRNVRSEDVLSLWAQILAGELKAPGSFSLRTLQLVKTLARHEWQLFDALLTKLWWLEGPRGAFLLGPTAEHDDDVREVSGISFSDFVSLKDAGLISLGEDAWIRMTPEMRFGYGGRLFEVVAREDEESKVRQRRMRIEGALIVRCIKISEAGTELASLRAPAFDTVEFMKIRTLFDEGGVSLRESSSEPSRSASPTGGTPAPAEAEPADTPDRNPDTRTAGPEPA